MKTRRPSREDAATHEDLSARASMAVGMHLDALEAEETHRMTMLPCSVEVRGDGDVIKHYDISSKYPGSLMPGEIPALAICSACGGGTRDGFCVNCAEHGSTK